MKAIAVVFFESTRAVGDEAGVIRKYNRGNVRARIHSAICVTVEWPKNIECIKSRLDLQLWGHLTYCDDGFEQQRCEKQHFVVNQSSFGLRLFTPSVRTIGMP